MARRLNLFIVLGALSLLIGCRTKYAMPVSHSPFEQKEIIANAIKMTVKPLQAYVGKKTKFRISLESFENKKGLEMDLTQTALMIDEEGTPYRPEDWKEEQSQEYSRTGILTFASLATLSHSFKLVIFEEEEHDFEWEVSTRSATHPFATVGTLEKSQEEKN